MPEMTLTAIVNEVPFPVDLKAVTAAQTLHLEDELGVSFADLLAGLDASTAPLHHVVAIQVLSLQQAGEPADIEFLLSRLTAGDEVTVHFDDGLPEGDPSAVADYAVQAIADLATHWGVTEHEAAARVRALLADAPA